MKWLKNLKIQTKLFIAFGIFIILMVGFVFFAVQQFSYANDAYNSAVKRQINISEASGTLAKLRFNNISTSFSYYDDGLSLAIAGLRDVDYEGLSKSFIQNVQNNRNNIFQDSSLALEQKESRINAYYRIEYVFTERFYPIFPTILEGLNAMNLEQLSHALSNAYVAGRELTSLLDELYDTASDITAARTDELEANSRGMVYSLFAVAAGIMIISLLVALYMGKIITSPIADMEKAMVEISGGNLNFPIRNGYKDELGALSNRIGDMVDNILEINKSVAAIDYLDTMIYVTDLDYNLIYINRRLANMFHIDRDTFKMKKCYKALRGKDYPCQVCQLPAILKDKESFPSIDYRDTWDEALATWIGGRASIIRWTDGNIVHYQTINDESQKKKYEEELQKAAQDAEAASISKTTFLANMSHEIRTPMNSIIGFSELALDGDVSDKTRDYLSKIMLNSEWLLQIINDILDISKIESGKMELEKIPFDLHELFIACRTIITPKADEKGVDVYFYAEPSIGKKLVGDPVRLRQVLLNILSNAVKFTNASGIVKVSATVIGSPGDDVSIGFEIKDSGIGMTSDQIAKIAEPFTQAEAGITRKYGGTGLGLAISKNIIEMMGGSLNIESTLGVGSKFYFTVTFSTIETKESDFDEEIIKGSKIEKPYFDGEILICEDNQMNQQMLCDHLERIGLRPTIAENGLEGLETVHNRLNKGIKPFDLIFMDIHMPVMDGIEAASKIAKLGTETPIVALTANVMANDKEMYLKNGMMDYVGKPFVSQELWRCLLKYLKPIEWKSVSEAKNRLADEKLLSTLRVNFVSDHQNTYKKITSAIASGDIKLAHRLVHSLKSNAALLGKAALQKASADVEILLKDGKNQVTPKDMNILEMELQAVLDELEPLVKAVFSEVSPEIKPLGAEEARKLAIDLRPLLESGNPDCLKYLDFLRSMPGTEILIQQMENLDFDEALETFAGIQVVEG